MPKLPLSKQFLQELRNLHIAHKDKRITDEEMSRLSDELKQKEALTQENLGQVLVMQALSEVEEDITKEIDENIQQQEEVIKAQKQAEQAEEYKRILQEQDEKRKKDIHEYEKKQEMAKEIQDFDQDIKQYLNQLERSAAKWKFNYNWLQVILLSFSATTATIAAIDGVPRWLVAIIGLVATIAGGLLTTFKIQDRIYASRKAVAEVTLERQRYDRKIEEYKDMDDEMAFLNFSRSIISIQGQEMLQEVELWNTKKDEKNEKKLRVDTQDAQDTQNIIEKPEESNQAHKRPDNNSDSDKQP